MLSWYVTDMFDMVSGGIVCKNCTRMVLNFDVSVRQRISCSSFHSVLDNNNRSDR